MPTTREYHGRRDAPTDLDLTIRTLSLRLDSVDEKAHTVRAVLTTESRVSVYDWRQGEIVEEVLTVDGATVPGQLPLLNTHSRWDVNDVLGSVREIERTTAGDVAGYVGTLSFAAGDVDADRVWNKVRQGHLRDVSIGYHVSNSVDIEAGKSATVGGRLYTAGALRLRIATAWQMKELSVVPIGADELAKTRGGTNQHERVSVMNTKLRAYLESIGLRADADEASAWTFFGALPTDKRAEGQRILARAEGDPTPDPAPTPDPEPEADPAPTPDPEPEADDEPRSAADVQHGRQLERTRVATIRNLAGTDIPTATVGRAISEGWNEARTSSEFLEAVRSQRNGGTPTDTPYHQTGATGPMHPTGGLDRRAVACGLMAGGDIDPLKAPDHNGQRAVRGTFTEQDADRGDFIQQLSMTDVMRICAELDNPGKRFWDPQDAYRAAMSGASFPCTGRGTSRLVAMSPTGVAVFITPRPSGLRFGPAWRPRPSGSPSCCGR